MKCEDIQPLHGAYLDSELDAKTALEIQQHLTACPDCARVFATGAKLDAQITSVLRQGQRTGALWEQIEKRVVSAAQPAVRASRSTFGLPSATWWRELLWPCPQAWAGLAAAWAVILAVNLATAGDTPAVEVRRAEPPSRELRQLLKAQRQMLAELGGAAEKLAVGRSGSSAPQPRSQRPESLINT
jgi:anti-sigma factor RsiW